MNERYTRLAPTDEVTTTDTDTFRYVFSNESKGRDGHVVRNAGIEHDNYDRNPVVLWAHDDTTPPIGRGSNINTKGLNCRIDVTFATDVLPFAKTIRDLVAGKWLRALSMSWAPIKYRQLPDHSGGLEFQEVDLLEVSVVPLPALADALLDARSHGIDVKPLRSWASRALDKRVYRAAPRAVLEAIHRATLRSTTSLPSRSFVTRDERARRASEIQARVQREDDAVKNERLAYHNAVRRGEAW